MNDLRGLSRGSKAAVVVVLVILLQVIVVSVVGLGAIARDRESGVRSAEEDDRRRAEATALAALERLRESLRTAVAATATAALTARDPGGERGFLRHGPALAFGTMLRVDAEGRVYSFGRTLLHVPIEAVAAAIDRADADRRRALDKRIEEGLGVSEAQREYARSFPFHLDPRDDYPTGVGHALAYAERAVAAAAGKDPAGSEADAATRAVLLAFETVVANEGRPLPPAAHRQLDWFSSRTAGLARDVPGAAGEALVQGLADLRRAREEFESVRGRVLEDAAAAARQAAPPRIFSLPTRDEVVAITSLPSVEGAPPEALLVLVDRRLLAAYAEEEGAPASGRDVAFWTRVVPRTDPRAGEVHRLPLVVPPDFDTGLDVAVQRSGPSASDAGVGPREVFYWFILALAGLGLAVSGLVLLRIFRREVRLARLKTDFVSNLSHELKTPLTSIALFVEMVRDGRAASGPDLREAMDVIAQESERLQRIVARMIDVVRREAAPTEVALAPGDLNEPVRAAAERFRRLERSSGLDLAVDLDPALPPVRFDAAAIDDVVTNLLSNAWKYRRGETARIRVTTRPVRRRVELVVEDDGIGIPRHERRKVFEMFYRAEDYLSRAVPGTGLGLALVRTIVRAHRGKVRVEPAASGGTVFRLRFPAAKGVVAAAPRARPPAAAARAASPAGGAR